MVNAFKPIALVTGALLVVLLLDRRLPSEFVAVASRSPAIFGVILGLLALAGVPFSLNQGQSFGVALTELVPSVFLMIAIGAAIEHPIDAYRLSAVHVVGALIFSVFVLTRFTVGAGGRLGNLVHYDANDLGLLLVCTLPLAEWCALHSARLAARLGALAAIPVFLVTLVKTGSRGGFLGLVAVVAYGIFANRSAPLRRRLGLAALAGVLLVGAAGATYWKDMNTILNPTRDYNWAGQSETGRMSVWKRGMGYMLDHPVTGVGAGAFAHAEGTISPLAQRQMYGEGLKWSAPHNSFLQVGAEIGLPGLAAFLALLIAALARARRAVVLGLAVGDGRAAAMGDALAASLVGYAVSGFFLTQGYAPFTYSLIGIAIGLHGALAREAMGDEWVAPVSVPARALGGAGSELTVWNADG